MSTFEFVAVLISIVVGLGITRILSGLSSLLEHRATVRVDPLTLVWAALVLGFQVSFWWIVVGTQRDRETWLLPEFWALFLYGIALYFLASLVLPADCSDGPDLRERFEEIRRPFFTVWLLSGLLEWTDTLLRGGVSRVIEFGPGYVAVVGGITVFSAAGLWIADRRFHWFFAVFSFLGMAAWSLSRFSEL